MSIVVLDGFTLNPGDLSWDAVSALGELTVYDRTPEDLIVARIGNAPYIFTNKTPVSRATMDKCPELKFIGVLATGYNLIDVDAAKEKGIAVTNIPTYGTPAVAQMVFALLLEICHHVAEHSDSVMRGEWTEGLDWCFWKHPLIELSGKTMGIIGFGRIGQTTAGIAQALGMNVLAVDDYQNKALESATCKYATLDEMLGQADVISLHCPLFPSTKGIVNKDTIAKMKTGVILINTSRGPLVVEEDLAAALNSGKVYAAGVDVVSTEPIKEDNPLLKAKNIFITPHIAWAPKEARARLMNIAAENLAAYLSGKPVNVVNA